MSTLKSLSWAHPLVRDWFLGKYDSPTSPQIEGWPSILAGKTTLISAPTGSGKTFAAFLTCINRLVCEAENGTLKDEIQVLYISPLKALSNDIQKNLLVPLTEIREAAKKVGKEFPDIRVSVRTGDTLTRERQAMLKKPPHILVTTPESLYILLTAEKSRALLSSVKTVIVDEIHALVNDKRGAHLALSLERLTALCNKPPLRIGLSATQKPLQTVAEFLAGNRNIQKHIVDIGHARHLDLKVEVPLSELSSVASNEMWDEIYDKIASFAKTHQSTLIFVNTRRLAERVAHHLGERLGEGMVAAHHGSLSRKLRFDAENKLKNGELKALVATASLELGIDIGFIDLVCQIGSPRAIATALQRVGRAGHFKDAISKGRLFATTRDELLECAALVYAISQGDLDEIIIPQAPLDILAQQIVAICQGDDWREDDLFKLIKKAYPYRELSRETFNSVLSMLAEGVAGSRGRYGAYLFRDQVHHTVKPRRGSRITAITSGGAIPDNALYSVVVMPEQNMVGTVDEDFAIESNRGDIFLLGTTSWRIHRVESKTGRLLVEDAHGAPPSVPFWRGEAPGRSAELSQYVSKLREKIANNSEDPGLIDWLKLQGGLDQSAAEQLLQYVREGRALLGAVPTQNTIIAERFFDETGGMQLIIHAPFGSRINKAWGLALRKKFCRSFNFELQAAATDDGLNISLAEQHSFPLSDVFQFLHPNSLTKTLTQAVLQSPIFATRFRWNATRSLAIPRFRFGKKTPPHILRVLVDDLLAAVFPDAAACQDNLGGRDLELPDHPLTNESMKDALHEALDLDGLHALISKIVDGKIQCIAIDTPQPSVFAHEILNANPYAFLDDTPLEERRARAVTMRRFLPENILQEVGKLSPMAIATIEDQVWPDLRNADELHDFLQTCIALPTDEPKIKENWTVFFQELLDTGRAGIALAGKEFWVAAEVTKPFEMIYPHARWIKKPIQVSQKDINREEALLQLLRGYLFNSGPMTSLALANKFDLSQNEIDQALIRLESTGLILRGQFKQLIELEWCERRILARIHHLTVSQLRREIEPVSPLQFVRWLLKWQHVAAGEQLRGEQGLIEVIRQLQGFEMPANAVERQIFARRVADYDKTLLDHLCYTGIIGWGKLSVRETNEGKRILPTSVALITFFLREEAEWLSLYHQEEDLTALSGTAKHIYQYLKDHGASFFAEIARHLKHLPAEIENGLWELVAAGLITADGFDNLRALIDPKRRLDRRHIKRSSRFSRGRWSVLQRDSYVSEREPIVALCLTLLKRYGVVFRDLLHREKNLPRWRELLSTFRRLEAQGEIRGGRFVDGFLGEQFALPYAVQSLRAMKKEESEPMQLTLAAVDPLNLTGIILPGERVSAVSKKNVTLEV